jgi:GT2 family glycosyltransferase
MSEPRLLSAASYGRVLSEWHPNTVSVIIPSFDRLDSLVRCVESVARSEPKPTGGVEMIVITTTYGPSEIATIEALGASVLRLEGTVWASEARNAGAASATGEFLLFLDDDNVVAPNAIFLLYEAFQEMADVVVAGPVMYYGSDPMAIWCAGVARSRILMKTRFATALPIPTPRRLPSEDFPNCFMVHHDDFQSVGGFDVDRFPVHMEESDLTRRLVALGRKSVFCIPSAKVWHFIGTNFVRRLHMHDARRAFWIARSRTLYTAVYGTRIQWFVYVVVGQWMLATLYLGATLVRAPHRFSIARAYVRGMGAGIRLGFNSRRKRALGAAAYS